MKRLIYLAAVLAIVAACNKEVPASEQMPGEISFAADNMEMEVESKASATTTDNFTEFNVYCCKSTAKTSPVFNAAFSGTVSGGFKGKASSYYWPSTDPSYQFYAANYAISNADANGGPYLTVSSNDKDIVVAKNETPSFNQQNTLPFSHIFARLGNVNVVGAADGYSIKDNTLTIKVTPNISGKYNLQGQTWTTSTAASAASTVATKTGDNANDIYLVPGSYTFTASYTVVKGAYEKTIPSATGTVTLTKGQINSLKVTLPGGAAQEIKFTVTLAAWTTPNPQTVTFTNN